MTLPYLDRQQAGAPNPRSVHKGVTGFLHRALRPWHPLRRSFRRLDRRTRSIVERSLELQDRSLQSLQGDFLQLSRTPAPGQSLTSAQVDELLGLLCEIACRTVGMRPYPVQLRCALIIFRGGLVEMATGEGKSLAAAIAAILLAQQGRPVHVLTANDYLAERDAVLFAPLYQGCGRSVTAMTAETPPARRRQDYLCDIVYATGRELLGDYLRDRLKLGARTSDLRRAIEQALLPPQGLRQPVMRGLHAVIVDEADSVLIDEAVMPLILSAPRSNLPLVQATRMAGELVNELQRGEDYQVVALSRKIVLTAQGEKKLKTIAARLPRIWQGYERCRELMTLALMARELFFLGEHYVIQEGKLVLVDGQTGRLTPNRQLGIGLHQAVEAKEGLELSEPTATVARFSFQRFFRLFPQLGGMSGTVREAAPELWRIYHAPVLALPTHRPTIRRQEPWLFFRRAQDKYAAILDRVRAVHATGQPVLIGTRTVAVSELLAEMLAQTDIPCHVLNAVRHREEAETVARAGQTLTVTIATNMAGRGTDIKLSPQARDLGGLYVIAVEPQSSARLDRQLHGRAGRQGDPGTATTFASLEDDLYLRLLPPLLRRLLALALPATGGRSSLAGRVLTRYLQRRAERVAAGQRLDILAGDDWIDQQLSFLASARRPE